MVKVAVAVVSSTSKRTAFRYQRTPKRVVAHVPTHVPGALMLSIKSPFEKAASRADSGSSSHRSSASAFGQVLK